MVHQFNKFLLDEVLVEPIFAFHLTIQDGLTTQQKE